MLQDISQTFFKGKRPWSKIKDQVLDSYMPPYLSKVKNLQKPILLIDASAVPGAKDARSRGDQEPVAAGGSGGLQVELPRNQSEGLLEIDL